MASAGEEYSLTRNATNAITHGLEEKDFDD
jgi:hypothetical protein